MRCLTLADDCGLTPGVTETILRCVDADALCGASVMAGGACAREAARAMGERLAGRPSRRVGVHLNLLEGRCTAPVADVPLLADGEGRFRHNLGTLRAALVFSSRRKRAALLEQIAREWAAQADLVRTEAGRGFGRADGLSLYLDGHLHVHTLPELRPVLLELVESVRPIHVRVPVEPRYRMPAEPALRVIGSLRRELLGRWGRPLRSALLERGVAVPDVFVGAFCSGAMTGSRLKAGLARAAALAGPDDLVEIMFHPGGFSPEERTGTTASLPYAGFYLSLNRRREAELLLSSDFNRLLARYDASRRQGVKPEDFDSEEPRA